MSARRPSLLRAQTDEPRSPQHLLAPHGPLHRTRSATALASIQYIATQTGGLSPRDTLPAGAARVPTPT
ncbi:hypothetical protein H2203_008507 [Taxawa tesnikishii (nom. ined.)]|nr:hypothetical protein H2203_008507 [Dothideales sp. JES 119]